MQQHERSAKEPEDPFFESARAQSIGRIDVREVFGGSQLIPRIAIAPHCPSRPAPHTMLIKLVAGPTTPMIFTELWELR